TGSQLAPADAGYFVTVGFVAVAAAVFLAVRRLARRMEERADARARMTVGPEPFARALQKVHAIAQAPLVVGGRRVHPDLAARPARGGRRPGAAPASPAAPPGPRRRLRRRGRARSRHPRLVRAGELRAPRERRRRARPGGPLRRGDRGVPPRARARPR